MLQFPLSINVYQFNVHGPLNVLLKRYLCHCLSMPRKGGGRDLIEFVVCGKILEPQQCKLLQIVHISANQTKRNNWMKCSQLVIGILDCQTCIIGLLDSTTPEQNREDSLFLLLVSRSISFANFLPSFLSELPSSIDLCVCRVQAKQPQSLARFVREPSLVDGGPSFIPFSSSQN